MSLITIIVVFLVVGIVMWLINQYAPMDAKFKNALNIIVLCFLVLWVLLGLLGGHHLGDIRIGKG